MIKGSQRGSVLAGTIALSLVLATGAASFLALSSAWESEMNNHVDRTRLLLSGETGLQLGARWIREERTPAELNLLATGETPISLSADGNYLPIEGVMVKVALNTVEPGKFEVVSWSKMDPCLDILELRWSFSPAAGTAGMESDLVFGEWNEAFLPCN